MKNVLNNWFLTWTCAEFAGTFLIVRTVFSCSTLKLILEWGEWVFSFALISLCKMSKILTEYIPLKSIKNCSIMINSWFLSITTNISLSWNLNKFRPHQRIPKTLILEKLITKRLSNSLAGSFSKHSTSFVA